ncbi:MAG: DUF7619 domain-containing protein [Chitinophagales bacterium]
MFLKHTHKIVVFIFITLLQNINTQAQCTSVSESDSLALVDFYEAVGGNLLEQNGNWLETPISQWYGITLSDDGCSVKEINLSNQDLQGYIPDLNLPNLEVLNLANNQLTGEIPNFSELRWLKQLFLYSNNLVGEIPNFDKFLNLRDLFLHNNELIGEIPNFNYLVTLEILGLSSNNFSGTIPNFNNFFLRGLNLSNNQLTGEIPNFENVPNLEMLNLANNQLSGNIPNFNDLSNLQTLNIERNQLSGNIPNFTNLPNLETLNIERNQLSGNIPNFNDLPNLETLNIGSNQLSGNIPNFTGLPNLETLSLHWNQLNGVIPNFTDLPSLTMLRVEENNLNGVIPNFTNLPNLRWLNLYENQLVGSVPNFDYLTNLQGLTLCPNNLTGNIPAFNNCLNLTTSNLDVSCVISAKTTGTTFADLNGNCTKEEEEPTIPNAIIATTDSTSYAFSNENGFYTLKTDTGIYGFDCFVPNYLWTRSCESYTNAYTIEAESLEDSIGGFDFGFRPLVECPLMIVEVGTPLLRRCYQNTYTINYCNTGTVDAEEAEIHLNISEHIIPLESSIPYDENNENQLIFNLGTVGVGECGSFTLTDSLSCDAVLGITACVEAFAFPNDLCFEDTSFWDGSDLEVTASCLGDEVLFEITNVGEDMEQESEYRMYEDDIMSIGSPFQLMAGEVLSFSRDAAGQTFRLTADQTINHPISESVTTIIELCGANTDMASLGFVNTQSNINYKHFYDIACDEIIGSYDPNDKNVTTKGVGDEHRITDNQELEYKIRFQNVGSDTAFRVMIIDTIDTNFLDINSLKLGVSSHDYTAEIKDGKVLIFTFENIFLVHSEVNEPASHGFVMFKISQKIGNQKDDLIQNEASIYFDYNQPVITNKAFNTIGLPDSTTSIPIVSQIKGDIPASIYYENGYLHIQLSLAAKNLAYSFTLFDILGKQIAHEKQLFIPNHEMSVGDLRQGVYVFEIATNDGKKVGGKFIVP